MAKAWARAAIERSLMLMMEILGMIEVLR